MIFLLGVIIGLLLALIWITVSVKTLPEASKFIQTIQTPRKGSIIEPIDEYTLSIQERLDQAKKDGIDLRLEDL